ncbi:hypothetical protein PRUPE_5G191000 [Prunus persica]|uniref:Uncharacterized protein n=1 Tax=Prunus persica TaxID=3760 RepID=M5WR20_PRUPE|nr:hypothetical protein PRUPE_5G191000 [Prunus persica]
MVTATQFDGFMPMWNQADCIMKKAKQIKSTDDVEGLELLRWEDQKEIRNYVQSGGPPDTITINYFFFLFLLLLSAVDKGMQR